MKTKPKKKVSASEWWKSLKQNLKNHLFEKHFRERWLSGKNHDSLKENEIESIYQSEADNKKF